MKRLLLVLLSLRAWFPRREYKSGSTWALWRWTRVESEYILRLHVLKTPWWAICLHWINKPDKEPWLHDHPVSFLSCILRGGYGEKRERKGKLQLVVHRWFNFIRANLFDKHTIILVRPKTLTLALMGPKTREWGFHVPGGWIMWKNYYALLKAGHDVRGEAFWKSDIGIDSIDCFFVSREDFYKKVTFE